MMIGEAYCDAYIWLLKADEAVTRHLNERHLLGCTMGKLGKAVVQATVAVEEMNRALELLWEEKWVEGGDDEDGSD